MKKYSACKDVYPAVECRDDSENRTEIFNMLFADGDVELYVASEVDKVIARQKYKRCLAMAEWCDAEADVADADGDYDDMRWYQKWHTRWLDIAKKFKE